MMSKFLFLLAMLMALVATTFSASPTKLEEHLAPKRHDQKTPLKGASHLFASRDVVTCDKSPKVCEVGAGDATDKKNPKACCNKKSVDLKTDKLNCGACGVKSKQTEICCHGRIVNPMSDHKHCGTCDNLCKHGGSCALGMCSYA